jgi:hypothetical protein
MPHRCPLRPTPFSVSVHQRSDKYPFRRSSVQRRQRQQALRVGSFMRTFPACSPIGSPSQRGFGRRATTPQATNFTECSTSGWKALAVCLVLLTLWSRTTGTKGTGGERCRGDDALKPLAQHREGHRNHHHLSPHAAHVQSSLVLQQPRGSSHGGRSRSANSPYSALWVRSARQRGHFGCRANRKSSRLV